MLIIVDLAADGGHPLVVNDDQAVASPKKAHLNINHRISYSRSGQINEVVAIIMRLAVGGRDLGAARV